MVSSTVRMVPVSEGFLVKDVVGILLTETMKASDGIAAAVAVTVGAVFFVL